MNVLFELFKDSFLASFIFYFHEEFAFSYILFFEQYNHNIAAIVTILGSLLGFILTYIFFFGFAEIFKSSIESSGNYPRMQRFFSKYSIIIFSVSLIPGFMVLLPAFAGMIRYNIKAFIFYIILYRSSYYFYLLYG